MYTSLETQVPNRDFSVVQGAHVWDLLGGSTHAAVSADVALPFSPAHEHRLTHTQLADAYATSGDFHVLRPSDAAVNEIAGPTAAPPPAKDDEDPTTTDDATPACGPWDSMACLTAHVSECLTDIGAQQRLQHQTLPHLDLFVGYLIVAAAVLAVSNVGMLAVFFLGNPCSSTEDPRHRHIT